MEGGIVDIEFLVFDCNNKVTGSKIKDENLRKGLSHIVTLVYDDDDDDGDEESRIAVKRLTEPESTAVDGDYEESGKAAKRLCVPASVLGGDEEESRKAVQGSLSIPESTNDDDFYIDDDNDDDVGLFVTALSRHDWDLARRVVVTALSSNPTTKLNSAMLRTLQLLWFLTTEDEMQAVSNLISLIISLGANDLGQAVIQTTHFVSLLPVCRSSQAHLATAFTQSWRAKTDPKTIYRLQKGLEWRLDRCQYYVNLFDDRVVQKQTYNSAAVQGQLQLGVFGRFLDLACTQITTQDFTHALFTACTIHIALSNADLVPLPISTTVIPKFLDMLVKARGSEQWLNSYLQLCSNNGCIELVQVLLQISHRNDFRQNLNVDMAFRIAAFNCDIEMLGCLAEEVEHAGIYETFVVAAFKGCIHVVLWFVERGMVGDHQLYKALVAATSNSQELVAAYLLRHVPRHVLVVNRSALLIEVGRHNVNGVKFLLQSDFLGNPADTYAVADSIAWSDIPDVTLELREYLMGNWSKKAFILGYLEERDHYVNVMRILKLGRSLSAKKLQDLPPPIRIAITYLPLYRECVENGSGCLLSHKIRGKLFEATRRLGCKFAIKNSLAKELLAQLKHCLPQVLLQK